MENKKVLKVLLLIILLGLFLRLYGIGSESFWIDEAATAYTTQQNPKDIIKDIQTTSKIAPDYFNHGGQSPFYYLLANYWTKIVGLSESMLRSLSAIFGVISIYILFLIGKMIFDYRVGLVSALILSINYLHINYSQEAKTYSLIVLLTLLTVYFLLNALKQKKVLYWAAYAISAALLIYAHYFGFFILIFEYLFLLLFWKEYRGSLKSIIISGISIFVLYIPWIPVLLRQVSLREYLAIYLGKNIVYDLARIFVQFNSWFTPDLETRIALRAVYHSIGDYAKINLSSVSVLGWLTIISVLLLTAFLGWHFVSSIFIKNRKISANSLKDQKYIFLLMWLLIPIVVPIIITIISPQSPVFGFVQYTLFASPAYYLIAAKGILKSKKYMALLVLLVILSALPLYSYYANFDKQQWRETAEYIKDNKVADEFVVVNKANQILPLSYYYKAENVVGTDDIGELGSIANKKNSFWFIYVAEKYGDPKGLIKGYLDENYKISEKAEFTGIKVFHYTKNLQ